MCSLDYEIASVYCENYRKSRKQHVCSECGRTIEKSEKYKHVFGVWENKVSVFKTCLYCLEPQDWLRKECGGFLHGNLEDEILEHASEYRKMFLYRWLIGIRKKWNFKIVMKMLVKS